VREDDVEKPSEKLLSLALELATYSTLPSSRADIFYANHWMHLSIMTAMVAVQMQMIEEDSDLDMDEEYDDEEEKLGLPPPTAKVVALESDDEKDQEDQKDEDDQEDKEDEEDQVEHEYDGDDED
jgi:hypothetical protein